MPSAPRTNILAGEPVRRPVKALDVPLRPWFAHGPHRGMGVLTTVATGPAPSYVASLESPRREALVTRLERSLPRSADGTISLVARAWVVRRVVRRIGLGP